MFEKYNEKARRALFFARYEASKLGSRVIESEHILLGILREGEETVNEIFRRFQVKPEDIRREIEGERVFVERISSTAELPLSEESKKILAYASHEAESMLHATVGSEHLLIGILRVEGCTAMRILAQQGFDVYTVREEALAIAKDALGNLAAAAAVDAASVEAKAGRGLARPLREAGLFPARTIHLLQLGEEAAQLAAMSLKAADLHDEQARLIVQRIVALAIPIITIAMGVAVAGIVGSLLTAMLSLNDLAV